jgi:hypothetical protein
MPVTTYGENREPKSRRVEHDFTPEAKAALSADLDKADYAQARLEEISRNAGGGLELTEEELRSLPPSILKEYAQRMRECRIALARIDINEFVKLVLRDESSGKPVKLAHHHKFWHMFLDAHPRCVLWSHVESGKTQQLCVARVLWLLGRDPNMRFAIVSNTHGQATKLIRNIARYITQNSMLRQIFPKLKKSEPWTYDQITVVRDTYSKDASIQAAGVHGNILGSRLECVILDDILDYENTKTPGQRQELWDWYHATLAGRLVANGRVYAVGTAWHPDDLQHRFARTPGWAAKRFPVIGDDGELSWESQWPRERIELKRAELGPLEFARQMMCVSRDDEEARFKREWIDACMKRGEGMKLIYSLDEAQGLEPALESMVRLGAARVYTGVDLGVQKKKSSDYSTLFTVAVMEDASRRILNVEAGKWSGPEIIDKIVDNHRRYNSICVVENNAAQDFILQFAREKTAVPLIPFTTGRNKAHPEFGIESLAAELANGKWIIPNDFGELHPALDAWVTELLYYDPNGHTGDRLMASWFAREGARSSGASSPMVSMRVIG